MKSIRHKLIERLVTAGALLWAVCGLGVYFSVRTNLYSEFDRSLFAKAQGLSALAEVQKDGKIGFEFDDSLMPQFAARQNADSFELWDSAGHPIERSDSLKGRDLPRLQSTAKTAYANVTLDPSGESRMIALRFYAKSDEDEDNGERPESKPGAVVVAVASSRANIDHFLAVLRAILGLSGLLVVGGTWAMAAVIVRRGLQPLQLVAERAREIDPSFPGTRFPVETMPAELAPICRRLNDSLERIEASFERERQFSGDVAHELRTPIAELRTLIEVAMKWPEDFHAESALPEAHESVLHMEAIVTQMLALLRCERGIESIRAVRVNLAELVAHCWTPFASLAEGKHLNVAFQIPANVELESDPSLLTGILTNLLSNAADYTPGGGWFEVRLVEEPKDQPAGFKLIFANTASDLAPEDLPRLFQRYWRKDAARSSGGHHGLGLSLAAAFARSLGLELRAEFAADGRLQMILAGPQPILHTEPSASLQSA